MASSCCHLGSLSEKPDCFTEVANWKQVFSFKNSSPRPILWGERQVNSNMGMFICTKFYLLWLYLWFPKFLRMFSLLVNRDKWTKYQESIFAGLHDKWMALSLPFPFPLSMRQLGLKNVVKFDLSKRPSPQEGPNWSRKGNLLHDICPLLQRNDKTSATPTLQATPACSTGKSDQLQGLTGHTKVGNTVRVVSWLNECWKNHIYTCPLQLIPTLNGGIRTQFKL
jgi:hypothetical protein